MIQPLLIQISGVVSTAIDLYYLKKSRELKNEQNQNNDTIDIDEVVLVGGGSLIPCIKQTVRDVLITKNIPSFSIQQQQQQHQNNESIEGSEKQHEKEFCSSISPYECVVNGLAIRGGLLMGVESSILQDILMIDVNPSAIGILVWENNDIENETNKTNQPILTNDNSIKNQSNMKCYFEPLIERGMSLPCKVKKRYQIDKETQERKILTLHIYEEIYNDGSEDSNKNNEEILDLPDVSNNCNTNNSNGESNSLPNLLEKEEKSNSLILLGIYELPIGDCMYQILPDKNLEDEITGDEQIDSKTLAWYVDVEFSIDSEGVFKYSVCSASSIIDSQNSQIKSNSSIRILWYYVLFLFILYSYFKLFRNDLTK